MTLDSCTDTKCTHDTGFLSNVTVFLPLFKKKWPLITHVCENPESRSFGLQIDKADFANLQWQYKNVIVLNNFLFGFIDHKWQPNYKILFSILISIFPSNPTSMKKIQKNLCLKLTTERKISTKKMNNLLVILSVTV